GARRRESPSKVQRPPRLLLRDATSRLRRMTLTQASGVRWDLSPLFESTTAAREAIAPALALARRFEGRWRGRLESITPDEMAEALAQLGEIDNRLSRISSYAMLRRAVDVTSEENRD